MDSASGPSCGGWFLSLILAVAVAPLPSSANAGFTPKTITPNTITPNTITEIIVDVDGSLGTQSLVDGCNSIVLVDGHRCRWNKTLPPIDDTVLAPRIS